MGLFGFGFDISGSISRVRSLGFDLSGSINLGFDQPRVRSTSGSINLGFDQGTGMRDG